MYAKVMDPREEPIPSTLLNQYNFWLHTKYLFLYQQINEAFLPYQRNFFIATNWNYYGEYKLAKCQRTADADAPHSNRYVYQTRSIPKS